MINISKEKKDAEAPWSTNKVPRLIKIEPNFLLFHVFDV